jgi:hypothetical protein
MKRRERRIKEETQTCRKIRHKRVREAEKKIQPQRGRKREAIKQTRGATEVINMKQT